MRSAFGTLPKVLKVGMLLLSINKHGYAQDTSYNYELNLDIPAIDLPFNLDASRTGQLFDSYSMQQSLAITQNFHNINYYLSNQLWHKIIKPKSTTRKIWNRVAANVTSGAVDYAFTYYGVVLSPQWLHEEFHRNGLTIRNIASYNETYNQFNGGYANGSISRVKDEDLIRFKREAPQEMIRSFAAGIESEYLLLRNMQKDNFFKSTRYPNILMNILLTNHAVGYVNQFKRKDYDHSIDLMNQYGTIESERDYVGWDFTPWVYDLHRPSEPYEDRGVHPSGNGIDRAIKTTKLNRDEYQYLEKMGKMQYLNFITPFMIGIDRISLSPSTTFNFAVRHYLNSFGYDLTIDLFIERNNKEFLLSLHKYSNNIKCFPGLEIESPSINYTLKNKQISFSPAVMLWMQPENFYGREAKFGGSLKTRVALSLNHWLATYAVLEAKTKGWVAGNPYLSENIGFRMGLYATIRQ